MSGKIFTVPLGAPFLHTLAKAVLSGELPGNGSSAPTALQLADITLLLPTRRAARAAERAFLEVAGTPTLILPTIRPISTGDEDQSLIATIAGLPAYGGGNTADLLSVPTAVNPLERMLVLMRMVTQWHDAQYRIGAARTPLTRAQAVNLAFELAKLMDDIEREGVSLENLATLVPDAFAEHWRATVEFLKIVTATFPTYLEAAQRISPAARTNMLIANEARRIVGASDGKPVIVAGVTGSIPATVDLMLAVCQLPNGAVVVPGLDLSLDEESWQKIHPNHPEHPQFGLRKLLEKLAVKRSDVATLSHNAHDHMAMTRAHLISEALRPSATTARWRTYAETADRTDVSSALEGLHIVTAQSAHDEAEAIALILREAVETPGRTAALISPDRILARRVAVRLQGLGIRVDDSAGRPFLKTVPGTFLNLVIEAAASGFKPAPTMALLKHPLCRLRRSAFDMRRAARALEIIAYRRPYLGRGIDGLRAALETAQLPDDEHERQHRAARRLWRDDRDAALSVAHDLGEAFKPLLTCLERHPSSSFQTLVKAHIAAAEALAEVPTETDGESDARNPLWGNAAGEAASLLLAGIIDEDVPDFDVPRGEYADLFLAVVARENVRESPNTHPRVAIWGPMEARLQQPDVVVLGSLNEGTWPEAADPGPWLNRPMRTALGLPQPEEDVGRAALDFATQLGASKVYLTRAEKMKGVPTVPSRWLMRLEAVLDGLDLKHIVHADQRWSSWARTRDAIDPLRRNEMKDAPAPTPRLELRPRKLSVTAVEDWLTNPYSIFARHILALEPLPALGTEPGNSLRGALVHSVLSAFTKAHPSELPDDISDELTRIANDTLSRYTGSPRVAAFWLPRLTRFIDWFAATEPARRENVTHCAVETTGRLILEGPAGPFELTARADRIDVRQDGIVITDYKTGAVPSDKKVISQQAPQLPLEAAIASVETGFEGVSPATTVALRYIRASGGEPPGEEGTVKCPDVSALARETIDGLTAMIAHYDNPSTPYKAVRRPGYSYDYDDYAHLARVAEWSTQSDAEDEA